MTDDIVRDMGWLSLGTRLKRLGERLQGETQGIIDAAGAPVQAAQYPYLAALDRMGPSTVGDLVAALGVSQPAVTRTLSKLAALDLVIVRAVDDDQRKREATLTPAGRRAVAAAKRVIWPAIESAVIDLCAGRTGDFLAQITAIEGGLAEKQFETRAAPRHAQKPPARRRRA